MSWTPKLSAKEERILRALHHLMHKNHNMRLDCDGCKEVAGFLAVPGYEGNEDYPTVVEHGT